MIGLAEQLRRIGLGQLKLAPRGQVVVAVAIARELGRQRRGRMIVLVIQQGSRVSQAVACTGSALGVVLVAAPGGLELRGDARRDDEVVVGRPVLAAHQSGVMAAFARPVGSEWRDGAGEFADYQLAHDLCRFFKGASKQLAHGLLRQRCVDAQRKGLFGHGHNLCRLSGRRPALPGALLVWLAAPAPESPAKTGRNESMDH